MMNIVLSLLFFTASIGLTKVYCILAQNTKLMDKPNERSLHATPTVRGGGVIFIGLFLCFLPLECYFTQSSFTSQLVLFFSVALLGLISFFDDLYTLSAKPRFIVHAMVAGLVAAFMRPEILDFGLFFLTNKYIITMFLFFTMLWAINHFNFMDGLDGFCGSQALFLFVSYALLFSFNGAIFYQDLCLMLILGLLGFLVFNFPPAKLFMGDVGSATLGLISFTIAIIAQQKYQTPILYWFILNSLFLFDATITLLRRVLNKEKWFSAHRKHAYQRLKQLGIDTRFILLGQLVINSSLLIAVLLLYMQKIDLSVVLVFIIVTLLVTYSFIEKLHPMFEVRAFKP